MASTLGKIIADFSTTLNLKVAIWATTATLDSATDDDGVALPTGSYFLTIDGNNSSKEYIYCTLTGTALTSIQNVSRQGALTSGFARTHRKGAVVKITDFATLRKLMDLLDGTTSITDATFVDISFTGTTTTGLKVKSLTTTQRDAISNVTNGDLIYNSTTGEFNAYQSGAWSVVSSGSTQPNASTTVAGKVEIATSAESIAGTDTGGTWAFLSVLPSDIKTNIATAVALSAPAWIIYPYAWSSAPTGFLICDWSAVSRTTYATLFTITSTTYWAGDGSTTFNLPNLKGKVPVGVDAAQTEFDTLGETGGAKTHTLDTTEIPAHTHTVATASGGAGVNSGASAVTNLATAGTISSSSVGGGLAHNNLQPYISLNYIIKT